MSAGCVRVVPTSLYFFIVCVCVSQKSVFLQRVCVVPTSLYFCSVCVCGSYQPVFLQRAHACACVCVVPTSLYFCSVLASLVSQASTVALLLCRVVSRGVRSARGRVARLLIWATHRTYRGGGSEEKVGTQVSSGMLRDPHLSTIKSVSLETQINQKVPTRSKP